MMARIRSAFAEHQRIIAETASQYMETIGNIGDLIINALECQGTIFWCGNGGSAADSQHLAAELVGRFKGPRKALRSIALSANAAIMTSLANDDGIASVFARQLEAYANPGDVLIALSTSGESPNILQAIETATGIGVSTVGMLGKGGGKARLLAEYSIVVPANDTARIQEAHLLIGHCWCDLVDAHFAGSH